MRAMQTSFKNQEQVSAWISGFTVECAKNILRNARVGGIAQVVLAPFGFDCLELSAVASSARSAGMSVCFVALDNEIVGIGFQQKSDCTTGGWPDFDGSIVGAKVDTSSFDADVQSAILRGRAVRLDAHTEAFTKRFGFKP